MNKVSAMNLAMGIAMIAQRDDDPVKVEPRPILRGVSVAENDVFTTPTKGKRSRRRRSAKMRALGYVSVDGRGWCRSHNFLTQEQS